METCWYLGKSLKTPGVPSGVEGLFDYATMEGIVPKAEERQHEARELRLGARTSGKSPSVSIPEDVPTERIAELAGYPS